MASSVDNLQAAIDQQPISGLQIRVVVICALFNVLDGFDLLAIAFAAPAITQSWQLSAATLGVVFSAGLAGMTLGSLTLGPLADRIGRRKMILMAATLLGLSTLATSQAPELYSLLVLRFITGLAIGGLLPSLNTMVAEYAPDRWRNLAVSCMHLGYPVGGILGGVVAALLIPEYGWQSVFIAGGVMTLLMVVVLSLAVPESLFFLRLSNRSGAREQAETICQKIGIDPALLGEPVFETPVGGFKPLLQAPWLKPSLALLSCFFLCYITLYFLINWIPTILTTGDPAGGPGIGAGVALNIGGAVGMIVLALMSARRTIEPLIGWFFLFGVAGMILISQPGLDGNKLVLLAGFTGFFCIGGMIGLYSVAARLYPDTSRSSGVGLAIGAGRFGAILGPLLGGWLIGLEWQMSNYFLLLAMPLVIAAVVVNRIHPPAVAGATSR